MTIGFVYCAVSESFPNDCKIGITNDVPRRMRELQRHYRTPYAFTAYDYKLVKNPRRVEWLAHQRLAIYRNPKTEIFESPPAMGWAAVLAAIDQVIEEERRNPQQLMPRPVARPKTLAKGRGIKQNHWLLVLCTVAVLIIATLVRYQPDIPEWLPDAVRRTAVNIEAWWGFIPASNRQ